MTKDLNGREKPVGRARRWAQALLPGAGTRSGSGLFGIDDPRLVLVAQGSDDAEAASAALARGVGGRVADPDAQSVLRHELVLPASVVGAIGDVVAQEEYVLRAEEKDGAEGEVVVWAARVQLVDALHVSQERSRMAGLASRHGGRTGRWQVWQAPGSR